MAKEFIRTLTILIIVAITIIVVSLVIPNLLSGGTVDFIAGGLMVLVGFTVLIHFIKNIKKQIENKKKEKEGEQNEK